MEQYNIQTILRLKDTVFSFKQLFFLSGFEKAHLLKRRLSYYVKCGELYSIRRGLYAKDAQYDRRELAVKILIPSYISFETVLIEAGVIFQWYTQLFVASYQTKEIVCDGTTFVFKKLKDVILLNPSGILNKEYYCIATPERAFLDVLYLNKEYHFDNLGALDYQKIIELLPMYNNKRMEHQVKIYFDAFHREKDAK
jgi:hypothetical protein